MGDFFSEGTTRTYRMISAYFSLMLRGIWRETARRNYIFFGERNRGVGNRGQISSFEQPQQAELA